MRYTPEQKQEFFDLIEQGHSIPAAQEKMNIGCDKTPRKWRNADGLSPLQFQRKLKARQRQEILKARAARVSQAEIAELLGLSSTQVVRYEHTARMENSLPLETIVATVAPAPVPAGQKVGRGTKITNEDQAMIAHLLAKGCSQKEIAEAIDRDRSVIWREIKRNSIDGKYSAPIAAKLAYSRTKRPKACKLDENLPLRQAVVDRLNLKFSPEQISGDIARCYGDDETMSISHETIYQALYVQGKGALRHELTVEKALRTGRKGRKPKSRLPSRGRKTWVDGARLTDRPAEAADRAVPGHWEGDLIIGTEGSSALITLVERRSRFALISRLGANHTSQTVIDRLKQMVQELPDVLFETLTWDQGAEMAKVADFTVATGVEVFFCDPHSPWQRGTNENTNGLIRDFFPKDTDFSTVTDEEVAEAQRLLNIRPRKTLQWATPGEKLQETLGVALTA